MYQYWYINFHGIGSSPCDLKVNFPNSGDQTAPSFASASMSAGA